jgi:hypothetical protein
MFMQNIFNVKDLICSKLIKKVLKKNEPSSYSERTLAFWFVIDFDSHPFSLSGTMAPYKIKRHVVVALHFVFCVFNLGAKRAKRTFK